MSLTLYGKRPRLRKRRSISARLNGREPRRPKIAICPPVSSTARSLSSPLASATAGLGVSTFGPIGLTAGLARLVARGGFLVAARGLAVAFFAAAALSSREGRFAVVAYDVALPRRAYRLRRALETILSRP